MHAHLLTGGQFVLCGPFWMIGVGSYGLLLRTNMSRRQEGRFKGRRQPSASIYVGYICRCITNISLYEGLRRSVTCIPLSDLLMMLSSPITVNMALDYCSKSRIPERSEIMGRDSVLQNIQPKSGYSVLRFLWWRGCRSPVILHLTT